VELQDSQAHGRDLVSVVIPVFNAQDWISETLRSVLAQTYKNIELIIIDDGSTDSTPAIVKTLLASSSLPGYVICQKNRGPSAARNRGWNAASGQWIQFLDADDVLAPQKIEVQITSPAVQTADIVYSNWGHLTYAAGCWQRSEEVRSPFIGQSAVADVLLDRNFLQLGSQLFNTRALIRADGFDESYTLIEDVELCLRLAMDGAVFAKVETESPVFWYRDRPRSLSKSSDERFVEACVRNAKSAEDYLKRRNPNDAALIDAITEVYFYAARFYAEHDPPRFDAIVSSIVALKPNFVPTSPQRLRVLSQLIGYTRAERLAVAYRRFKRLLSGHMHVQENA
jgi:glycosyltransferase involved in cell wall biosynthesis